MPFFKCQNIKIKAVACAVPDDVEYTEEYAKLFDKTYVDKFIKSTGVKRRYASHRNGVTASDLCCASAEKILKETDYDRGKVDALIYASSSPDYAAPVTACVLQDRLGLSQECACYDVPLGCSAYVYGLYLAAMHLSTGCRSVLLLAGSAGDQLPNTYVPSEIPMLYGNSGSATLLEGCEGEGDTYGLLRSIGSQREVLIQPYGGQRHPFWMMAEELGLQRAAELNGRLYMDGLEVMRFSLREVVQLVQDFCEHFNVSYDDYEILACHQANRLIINNLARKIKFPQEKIPLPIVDYGNTGCGSVPLAICEHYTKHPSAKISSQILTCGFGIGLSLGIVAVTVNPSSCFPIIKVSERFDDGVTYNKFN
ncbi:3-oxoacyl-ACP synthase III family protein [Acutalibacter caecimuris]|uniref:3-oxoacyl-ACP synthase III family protein n=1 Tax=Acutalibacter caecimuris TaxID=3093657 RepID=UPI002AC99C24|nr:3-oxoacyl-[acyl-carrier-protein] synthase III C-terminal domain-containing protein [Acutalibacter sp. M00118]